MPLTEGRDDDSEDEEIFFSDARMKILKPISLPRHVSKRDSFAIQNASAPAENTTD